MRLFSINRFALCAVFPLIRFLYQIDILHYSFYMHVQQNSVILVRVRVRE